MQEMVAIDYLYVASWSLWLDLKLLSHRSTRCASGQTLARPNL